MSHGLLDTAVVDIDGTLLDSNYHHALAWSRAFAHVGRSVAIWRIHRHLGMGERRLTATASLGPPRGRGRRVDPPTPPERTP